MKHNAFDGNSQPQRATLAHSDMEEILTTAKLQSVGSFQNALTLFMEQHTDDEFLAHGFDDIEALFPEYKDLKPGAPELITRDQGWVGVVMSKVHKNPFSRIRTKNMDARGDDIRAHGYQKGARKQPSGNMKLMINGAVTLGTLDGANVEIVEEVGEENAFIFGMSSDEVIDLEKQGGYDPSQLFNTDQDIRQVLMQLINGAYSPNDPEKFRELYNALLIDGGYNRPDPYFILKDFRSYAEAQKRVETAYRDEKGWARSAILNVACSGKFSSDRTIQEYVDEIWKLDKVTVELSEN